MEWAEFVVKLTSQLIWIAIALLSLALTAWQLWDLYGFKLKAWYRAEQKARRADLEWRRWAWRLWQTPCQKAD